MWLVALPLQVTPMRHASWNWLDWLGIALWVIGWVFESVGDWQLAHFKSQPNNRGRVLREGLWKYTRHPNYFGDCLVWWGVYVVAAASDCPWWIVVSPIIMTILLLKVSGVRLLEQTIVDRRPEYDDYTRCTSSFVPWPPRCFEGGRRQMGK